MTVTKSSEEDGELEQATTRLTFKNPDHPAIDEPKREGATPYEKKYILASEEYQALRRIREELAVDLNEVVGELLWSIYLVETEDNDEYAADLLERLKGVEQMTKLTDSRKGTVKLTEIKFKNGKHSDTSVRETDNEHRWFIATKAIRQAIGTDIYLALSDYFSAIEKAALEDDYEELEDYFQAFMK